jgi:SAM-dependent methyltransferase
MQPTGKVSEIACGTGLWPEALAGLADTVTAIDAAPEVIEIARARVTSAKVAFEVADVFSWTTIPGCGNPTSAVSVPAMFLVLSRAAGASAPRGGRRLAAICHHSAMSSARTDNARLVAEPSRPRGR